MRIRAGSTQRAPQSIKIPSNEDDDGDGGDRDEGADFSFLFRRDRLARMKS